MECDVYALKIPKALPRSPVKKHVSVVKILVRTLRSRKKQKRSDTACQKIEKFKLSSFKDCQNVNPDSKQDNIQYGKFNHLFHPPLLLLRISLPNPLAIFIHGLFQRQTVNIPNHRPFPDTI